MYTIPTDSTTALHRYIQQNISIQPYQKRVTHVVPFLGIPSRRCNIR